MSTIEVPTLKGSRRLTASLTVPALPELGMHEHAPPGCGVLRVLTEKDGDKRYAWNPRSILEINEARDFFNGAVAQGLVPYEVDPDGKKSPRVMDEFDPAAGEVIFAPIAAVAGG